MTTRTKRMLVLAAVAAAMAVWTFPGWVHAVGGKQDTKTTSECSSGACTKRPAEQAQAAQAEEKACPYGEDCPETAAATNDYQANRCERYSACSLHGDLSGATGDTLDMYYREKTEDGRVYADFTFPEFRAVSLDGREMSSDALTGRPSLVAFVAAHCRHSMRAMPHFQEIADTYGSQGLRVVTVWVNSGSPEDVHETTKVFRPTYETWIHRSPAVGDAIGSHLVPSFFFVDEEGRVKEKWVGEKSRDALVARVGTLLDNFHRGQ